MLLRIEIRRCRATLDKIQRKYLEICYLDNKIISSVFSLDLSNRRLLGDNSSNKKIRGIIVRHTIRRRRDQPIQITNTIHRLPLKLVLQSRKRQHSRPQIKSSIFTPLIYPLWIHDRGRDGCSGKSPGFS